MSKSQQNKIKQSLNYSHIPNLNSCNMFREQYNSGKFSDDEILQLINNPTYKDTFSGIKLCDKIREKYRNKMADESVNQNHLLLEDIVCIGNATCPEAFKRWKNCMENQNRNTNPEYTECDILKRKFERCVHAITSELVKTSYAKHFDRHY